MTNRIELVLNALSTDLAPTRLDLTAGVYDCRQKVWLAGVAAETPTGFGPDSVVLVLPGRQADISDGHRADLTSIADAVSDWAMDELGLGWPELADADGRFLALLRPVVIAGEMWWHSSAGSVPLGRLSELKLVFPPTPA